MQGHACVVSSLCWLELLVAPPSSHRYYEVARIYSPHARQYYTCKTSRKYFN